MRKLRFAVPLILLLVVSLGCATTPWKRQAVTAYEGLAETMKRIESNARLFRDTGVITADQYAKVGAIYKDAKPLLEQAGETLKLAISTEDAIVQNNLMEQYGTLIAQFKTLFYKLLDLAVDFGVISQVERTLYKINE